MKNAIHLRITVGTLCLALVSACGLASAKPTAEQVTLMTTPGGVEFGMWGGPDDHDTAAPTLIVLTGSIMDSFPRAYFLRAGNLLGPRGFRCVAIDLPDHGKQATPGNSGVPAWAKRAEAGDDFVAEFNARMKDVVDFLIDHGLTDPEKIVASGTSRGGFMAIHYTVFDPRVRGCVAYAPATDLRVIDKYFAGVKDAPLLAELDVNRLVPELVGRPMLIFVGDRDDGVGTDTAIGFARKLSTAALKADVPSEMDLHVLSEPRGHSLPADLEIPAARWIYKLIEGKELTDL